MHPHRRRTLLGPSVIGLVLVWMIGGFAFNSAWAQSDEFPELSESSQTKKKGKGKKSKKKSKKGKKSKKDKKSKKKKSPHKLTLGFKAGGGYDSNMFLYKDKSGHSFSEEAGLKAKYQLKATKRLKWGIGAGFSDSYRVNSDESTALKLGLKADTGLRIKLFGGGGKKKFKPKGQLGIDFKYSGTFNPVLEDPEAPVDDILDEEDLYLEDEMEDAEDMGGGGDEDAADDEDEEDDDEDESDEDETDETDETDEGEEGGEEGEDESGEDGDAQSGESSEEGEEGEEGAGGSEEEQEAEPDDGELEADSPASKTFGGKPNRHNVGGVIKFTVDPARFSRLGLSVKGKYGDVGETEGKDSSDFGQLGAALQFRQQFWRKRLTLNVGYGFGYKLYKEKVNQNDDTLTNQSHAGTLGLKLKATRWLKLSTSYRLSYLRTPDARVDKDTQELLPNQSLMHVVFLGGEVRILPWLYLYEVNSLTYTDGLDQEKKTALRFQALLGLRLKFTFLN